jgi:hypothetical protein
MSTNVGLQLFPPPPKKQITKKLSIRGRGKRPQSPPASNASNIGRARSPETADGRQSALSGRMSAMDGRQSAMDSVVSPNTHIGPDMPRSYTSFSDAPTLVRSYSSASHRSTAKPKFSKSHSNGGPSNGGPSSEEPMIRSIFPRYNPEIPLERQPYFPTQASPTHIPRAFISKAPYSPGIESVISGPLSAPASVSQFPKGVQEVPKLVEPATTEELKELWKVTNGWRVSQSEGRSFCLKMTSSVEVPVHTLSSATQPFYTLRLDPTSTSALLTMTRLDPYKHSKALSSPKAGGSSKNAGTEAIMTTFEESARRLPPNDGLVAVLYPKAASDMALGLAAKPNGPDDETIYEAAERECGRLVWDDDSKQYCLVHPALATPFKIQIVPYPAWSRVEYILEHPELPQNLVKLTRDGSGGGYLEVDTGVAARIEAFYIVDVAICAVLLAALTEEKDKKVERFEPPPSVMSFSTPPKKEKSSKHVKVEEMEVDLESQSSIADKKGKSALPAPTKGVLSILFLAFKFVIWGLTILVNTVAAVIIGVSNCLTKA